MAETEYNLVVIGSGPGGYVAAVRAAQLGMKVAVVERAELGGVCLNWGCIPTKTLLKSAELLSLMKRGAEFGITASDVRFDYAKIVQRSRDVAGRLSKGVAHLLKKNKIEHIRGAGRVVDTGRVAVQPVEGGDEFELKCDHALIATGGRPRSLPGVEMDGERVISSREALVLSRAPESIAIIGAGAIGVEFAYFFKALGAEVTIIEMLPQLLPLEDQEIAQQLARSFKRQKIRVLTDTRVTGIERKGKGLSIGYQKGEKTEQISADITLVAIGVEANVEGVSDVALETEGGFIKVDEHYQTSLPGVYAIGDVTGPPLLAHVASAEGIHAVEHMAGQDVQPIDYSRIPACTYCQPQVASIGLTEEKARADGYDIKVGRFPFTASGKAQAIGEQTGLVKLIFDARYGGLLGAHVIGSEATELIGELSLALSMEATSETILRTIHAHPTLSEAIMEAAGVALDEAIHV